MRTLGAAAVTPHQQEQVRRLPAVEVDAHLLAGPLLGGDVGARGGIVAHQLDPDFPINGQEFWMLGMAASLVVYALVQIFGSSADTLKKVIWIVIVAVFPIVGLIVWFFIGPGTPKK